MSTPPPFHSLPGISRCLESEEGKALQERYGKGVLTWMLRSTIARHRSEIAGGKRSSSSLSSVLSDTASRLERIGSADGRRAINATGILLHTGLGRSPLSKSAIEAINGMDHYSLLEVELESGERGKREDRIEELLCELTGCEAATVVNNNAAAIFLALSAITSGKEVIISRGQLIEIGGSFRMPEIMTQSGAILKEVGTTNRTHLKDYEKAITTSTGALVRVHPSNYRIHGFTSEPGIEELCDLGKRFNIPVIDDLGSGALIPPEDYGINDKDALVRRSIDAGSVAVCFSGDKLICGPQAGIICGTSESIRKMRDHTLFRMLRPDKLCLAALEATLLHFINGKEGLNEVPLYQMLSHSMEELHQVGVRILENLKTGSFIASIEDSNAYAGGGSSPDQAIPSKAIKIVPQIPSANLNVISKSLREGIPSVFCRIENNSLIFDLRSLLDDDAELLTAAINKALAGKG